jgi:hypothetical protein
VAGSVAVKLLQGKYELGEALRGQTDTVVYRADNRVIQRAVEIKTLRAGLPAKGPAADRLLREARSAGTVAHRNLQSVLDTGVDASGIPFVVFEQLRGPTLTEIIHANPNGLPEARAVSIMIQLLEGLQALHRGGLTHRGVSTDVIRVEPIPGSDELVKLFEFSEAAFQSEGQNAPMPHVPADSPFVAPELKRGNINHANVDVFSAGVVLHLMLAGPTGRLSRSLTEEMRRAIARATAMQPKERFPSAELFLQAVAMFDSSSGSVVARPSADALHADLLYLQKRRNTQMRKRESQSATAVVSQRAVLLTVEAVFKITGAKHWARFVEKVPEVDALLPGAPGAEQYGESGVPMDLFVKALAGADDLCGRGDMVLITGLGEAIGSKGVSKLAPTLAEPATVQQFVSDFPKLWAAISSHGEASVIEQTRSGARVAVSDQPRPSLELSAWMSGVIRGMLRRLGGVDVEVAVPASQSLGDAADIYGISWK